MGLNSCDYINERGEVNEDVEDPRVLYFEVGRFIDWFLNDAAYCDEPEDDYLSMYFDYINGMNSIIMPF